MKLHIQVGINVTSFEMALNRRVHVLNVCVFLFHCIEKFCSPRSLLLGKEVTSKAII